MNPLRGRELALLGVAIAIAVTAYGAVQVDQTGRLPLSTLGYGALLAVLFGSAHLAVRKWAPNSDPILLPAAAALNGVGIVLITRLDAAARSSARQSHLPLPRADGPLQLLWTAIAIVAFVAVVALVRDHTRLARYTYLFGLAGLVLLLLPVLPGVGEDINGARLWIRLGPMSLQPSEIAKLALMVFFAGYLVVKRDTLALASRHIAGLDLPRARDVGPLLLAWIASVAVLTRENDFGNSLLFFGIFVVLLYIATGRTSWLLIAAPLFVIGGVVAFTVVPHVHQRVSIWLNPFAHASSSGYQIVQGLFGMGTGGLTGTGLGLGSPGLVPYAKTDFILAAVGEELGLAGVMAILLLYGLIVSRGMRIALSCRDPFGKLLAAGLSFSMALQVFVIAGGVMDLIPLTGVTLPWLSYGGSSVVANWALIALLMKVGSGTWAPAPDQPATTQVVHR